MQITTFQVYHPITARDPEIPPNEIAPFVSLQLLPPPQARIQHAFASCLE
ncbi:hypothetical protein L915_00317, partial [Phytophthora nicotianae]